jgi:hypothetical protein
VRRGALVVGCSGEATSVGVSWVALGCHSGVPGNIMIIIVRVRSSTDPACKMGTHGRVTPFASYNVRSDSVQFSFPSSCSRHDHVYHGPQVDNQVPPL